LSHKFYNLVTVLPFYRIFNYIKIMVTEISTAKHVPCIE